jgi:hypothetical protein
MSQKYLRELVEFAQQEMSLLNNDLQNASTHYALQAATQRLFNINTYMLHNLIHTAYEQGTAPATAPTPPTPVAVAPTPVITTPTTGMPALPPPTAITQPQVSTQSATNIGDIPSTPGVANIIITAQGTKVISPSGVSTLVPQGEPVGLDATAGVPPTPLSEPGVETVVLPPGGGITPDLAAALAGLTNKPTA